MNFKKNIKLLTDSIFDDITKLVHKKKFYSPTYGDKTVVLIEDFEEAVEKIKKALED